MLHLQNVFHLPKPHNSLNFVIISLLFLAGCASNNKITQDYKLGTNFHQYKTFSWHQISSDIPSSNNKEIERAVESLLIQNGFQAVTEKADFILDMNIIRRQRMESSTGLGISIGLPLGNHGAIGLGTNKLLSNDNQQEGLIILDITALETHQIIWRGSAEAIPMNYFAIRNEKKLNDVLANLVNQFPPK